MNPNSNLSVCLIVKNEEKSLGDCLATIAGIASEIVVVDTGSSDATKDIALGFGARVFDFEWKNDFSLARNFAINHAKNKYILSIDADEILLNPDELLNILQNWEPKAGGYVVELVSVAHKASGASDEYAGYLLRLFLNDPKIRFYGRIHEQIIDTITAQGLVVRSSDVRLSHFGYSLDPSAMIEKQKRNLELLNIEISHNPNNGEAFYHRAKTYLALGEHQRSESDTIKALAKLNKEGAIYPQALNFGGAAALSMKNYELAIKRAMLSLEIVRNQAFANFVLGEAEFNLGNHSESLRAYIDMRDAILDPDPRALIIGDYRIAPEELAFRIGREYVALGKYELAEGAFAGGLSANSKDLNCLIGMANCYYKEGCFAKAKTYLETAQKIDPNKSEIKIFMGHVEKASQQYEDKGGKQIDKLEKTENIESQKPTKPLITLSMIVKNEEAYLADCLASARGVVDEIVIVDTGSTDKTKEIAQKFGAKIFDYVWNDDFASARNEAIKHSNGEWILYLDADERLKPECLTSIRPVLGAADDRVGAFFCLVESLHSQLGGGSELHKAGYPRIFRNYGYPNIQFQGRVHEQITPSLLALGKSIAKSNFTIIHIGYDQPREVMEQKIKRNYKLLMQHIQDEPENAYAWFQLGQTLGQMGLMKESEDAIRFAIEIGKLAPSVYASAAATLAQQCGNSKRFEEALFWADESLKRAPEQIYAIVLKAFALLYLNRKDESRECFRTAKTRLLSKRGMPMTGFDIEVPMTSIIMGLEKLEESE